MRVLLLGCYYSANLGDGVICESVANQIYEAFPNAEVIIKDLWDRSAFDVSRRNPSEFDVTLGRLFYRRARAMLYKFVTTLVHWDVQYISMNNRLTENRVQLDRICETECDLVIFAGGQMFMDAYALRLWYVIQHFNKKGIPVVVNACGTGPTYSTKLKKYLQKALNAPNVTAVSCRDDVNCVNENYCSSSKVAVETFDPALSCSECYGIKRNSDSNIVGLGIMWTERISPKKSLRFWHGIISEMEKKGIPWKVFVNGEKIDLAFARYVIETLPGKKKSFEECFVPVPKVPNELVETISRFRSIISFRLHSHIIATSLNIPSVAISWDDKVRFFFRKIGHPERCFTLRCSYREVLERLAAAEREGLDSSLIEKQKRYSQEWLYSAINQAMLSYSETTTNGGLS